VCGMWLLLGSGEAGVQVLPGHIGHYDVEDCIAALDAAVAGGEATVVLNLAVARVLEMPGFRRCRGTLDDVEDCIAALDAAVAGGASAGQPK
jgi:hypothetical protein